MPHVSILTSGAHKTYYHETEYSGEGGRVVYRRVLFVDPNQTTVVGESTSLYLIPVEPLHTCIHRMPPEMVVGMRDATARKRGCHLPKKADPCEPIAR